MRARILQLDQPSTNGITYTTEVIKDAISRAPDAIMGTIGAPAQDTISMDDLALMANDFRIQDGYLVAKITMLSTPKGAELKQLIDIPDGVAFALCGNRNINANGEISNFTIHSVSAIPKV